MITALPIDFATGPIHYLHKLEYFDKTSARTCHAHGNPVTLCTKRLLKNVTTRLVASKLAHITDVELTNVIFEANCLIIPIHNFVGYPVTSTKSRLCI